MHTSFCCCCCCECVCKFKSNAKRQQSVTATDDNNVEKLRQKYHIVTTKQLQRNRKYNKYSHPTTYSNFSNLPTQWVERQTKKKFDLGARKWQQDRPIRTEHRKIIYAANQLKTTFFRLLVLLLACGVARISESIHKKFLNTKSAAFCPKNWRE